MAGHRFAGRGTNLMWGCKNAIPRRGVVAASGDSRPSWHVVPRGRFFSLPHKGGGRRGAMLDGEKAEQWTPCGGSRRRKVMNLLQLYSRALALLGPEARLGRILAAASLALAAAQFAEPVLFGRIVDALAGAQGATGAGPRLIWLVVAWVGFGLFTIACGVTVALHADRLAHRRRQAVLAGYFEHVLQLPMAFHGTAHSGRLMKV